jgi:PAS domain S-box-containing protein
MDFSLLEFVPDAMVVIDGAGVVVHVNSVAEEVFGYPRAEILGQPVEILIPARHRAAHEGHRRGYAAAPRVRPMGPGLELVGMRRTGEEFAADISIAPLLMDGKRYSMAAVRDVTERRRTEEKARLYRKAQAEVRERDEFLSVASHELRTPVTALHLQLQMLRKVAARSSQEVPRAVSDRLDALDRQTRRVSLLVAELLDLSRMRLGRLELRREQADLAALAGDVVAPFQDDEAAAHGSPVRLEAAGPAVGWFDRVRLEQVVANLLANAVKFGEGRPIDVKVRAEDDLLRLEVVDRGIGVAPEDRDRIFGRFERAVSAQHFGGLGLGLFIARQIVEAHGGSIRVDGARGEGSTFTVELPRHPPAAEDALPGDQDAPPGAQDAPPAAGVTRLPAAAGDRGG